MSTNLSAHDLQLQSWAADLHDQKSSGLTIRQWCQQRGLSINTFNYRVKALKKAAIRSMSSQVVEVKPSSASAAPSSDIGDVSFIIGDVTATIHHVDVESAVTSIIRAARNA